MLDALIYLMECNYVIPVLAITQNWAKKGVDHALIRYFITKVKTALRITKQGKVLDMVDPPYSKSFATRLFKMISNLAEHSRAIPEYQKRYSHF